MKTLIPFFGILFEKSWGAKWKCIAVVLILRTMDYGFIFIIENIGLFFQLTATKFNLFLWKREIIEASQYNKKVYCTSNKVY